MFCSDYSWVGTVHYLCTTFPTPKVTYVARRAFPEYLFLWFILLNFWLLYCFAHCYQYHGAISIFLIAIYQDHHSFQQHPKHRIHDVLFQIRSLLLVSSGLPLHPGLKLYATKQEFRMGREAHFSWSDTSALCLYQKLGSVGGPYSWLDHPSMGLLYLKPAQGWRESNTIDLSYLACSFCPKVGGRCRFQSLWTELLKHGLWERMKKCWKPGLSMVIP